METLSQQTENQELTQEQISNHEQEMVAKAEEAEANSLKKDSNQFEESVQEEGLLAGKYKTQEELERAYKELEAKLGETKNDNTNEKTEEKTEDTEAEVPATKEEAKELAESKGLDFTELNTEYAENGELSPETYKKLADAGIDEATVNSYIAGQAALAEQNVAKLQASIGGEQSFNEMIEWAAENLNESEKTSFNKMVSDEATAEFAIKGLHARFKAEAGPNLLDGNPNGTSSAGFQSTKEMTRAMADPRYKVDPAYRKEVEQRIARSSF